MPRNRQRIDAGQLFQVERDAQPRLHGVDVHGRAAVFRLDTGGQAGDVLHGAGLVVDGHAGHKHGVFVHGVDELLHVEAAVGPGRDLHNVKAAVPQRADGQLNARVFKAGGDDFVPPGLPRQRRAQNGQVVALAAAGGKVDLPGRTVQRFGDFGARGVQLVLGQHGGVVQARRVGPAFAQRRGNGVGHGGVHHRGGGVIEIMQVRVSAHGGKDLFSAAKTAESVYKSTK